MRLPPYVEALLQQMVTGCIRGLGQATHVGVKVGGLVEITTRDYNLLVQEQ